jgi:hypothetical protein
MVIKFDPKSLNGTYDQLFGKGAYNTGIQNARNAGALKVQANLAKQDALKRLTKLQNASQKAAKNKSYNDAVAYWSDPTNKTSLQQKGAYRASQDILNDPNQQKAIKDAGYNVNDYIDAMYNAASDGKFRSAREYNQFASQLNKDNAPNRKANQDSIQSIINADKAKAAQDQLHQQSNSKKTLNYNANLSPKPTPLVPFKSQSQTKKPQQSFQDKYIFGPQEWLYNHTLQPVEKGVERFLTNMADELTPGGLKKHLNDGGKAAGLKAPQFVQEAASKPKTKLDKALDITGSMAGQAAPLLLSYGATSKLLNPLLSKLPQAGKIGLASKLLDSSVRGGVAMGAYGTAKEGMDAALHPNDSTLTDRLKRVGTDAAYGAVGDPLLRLGGMAAKKGIETAANSTMKDRKSVV